MQIQEEKPYDDINITPMLDLAYVLLVIFILMCTASVQGLKASLPHASNAPSHDTSKPKLQAITVANNGTYKLNGDTVTLAEIQTKLTAAKAADPDVPVVVRPDSATQYQSVMDVLTVSANVGITKVGLAAKAAR
jgi:biopolymer transport protein ExbD